MPCREGAVLRGYGPQCGLDGGRPILLGPLAPCHQLQHVRVVSSRNREIVQRNRLPGQDLYKTPGGPNVGGLREAFSGNVGRLCGGSKVVLECKAADLTGSHLVFVREQFGGMQKVRRSLWHVPL